MNEQGLGFWSTVWLLLRSARKRFKGRRGRQQQLLNQRSGKTAADWGWLGTALSVLFMIAIHGLAAGTLYFAILTGERLSTEQQGKISVSPNFLFALKTAESAHIYRGIARQDAVSPNVYQSEARSISTFQGGSKEEIARQLQKTFESRGTAGFVSKRIAQPGFRFFDLKRWNRLPAMLGSFVLMWWALMMAFQGEGLELDLQRRRHPMWEWLFSHPVPIGAVFLAEMLAPLAANPIYWTAPVFVGAAFGLAYGFKLGILATLLAGIPLSVALGCLGKALEIGVTLRVAPRQRGAVIGLMSWMGYASMMLLFLGVFIAPKISTLALRCLAPLAALPWPWLGLFLGATQDGHFSFAAGLLTCCAVACLATGISVYLSIWATQQGLAGAFGATDEPRSPPANHCAWEKSRSIAKSYCGFFGTAVRSFNPFLSP